MVGYLVVIATVLLLSSEDMWMLTGRQQPSLSGDDRATQEERIDAWFDSIGLTAREREIGLLLAYGRTQPWIAERLSISEKHCGHPRAPHLPEGGRARSPAIHRFGSFT